MAVLVLPGIGVTYPQIKYRLWLDWEISILQNISCIGGM